MVRSGGKVVLGESTGTPGGRDGAGWEPGPEVVFVPVLADGTGLGVDGLRVGRVVSDALSSLEQANNVTEVTITIATMMHLTIWNLLKETLTS